jgi:excisionase family DNA binding protein
MSRKAKETTVAGESRPLLLDVKEVAHLLCLGERTVWRLSSGGVLPKPMSVGRSKRWHRRAIEEFVSQTGQPHQKK